jgi:hypothetical protein
MMLVDRTATAAVGCVGRIVGRLTAIAVSNARVAISYGDCLQFGHQLRIVGEIDGGGLTTP